MLELFLLFIGVAIAGWLSVSYAIQQYKTMNIYFHEGIYTKAVFSFMCMICSPIIFILGVLFDLVLIQMFFIFTTGHLF